MSQTLSSPVAHLEFPWGVLAVFVCGERLLGLDWVLPAPATARHRALPIVADPLLSQLREDAAAYMKDPTHLFKFRLPGDVGTAFQRRVWAALLAIPVGETRTYGDLAAALSSGPRAVAQACRANPWPVVVPCHRVVSRSGWGGYAGAVAGPLIRIKLGLLTHEGAAQAF